MTEISGSICEDCIYLTSIAIPANVTTIKSWAFSGCTSLATLSFGSGSKLTNIWGRAFKGCAAIESVTLPNGLTTINANAFDGCSKLVTSLPTSLTTLAEYAFNNCTSLKSITIPSGVTALDSHVFYGCTGITSLTFHDKLTSISASALQGCTGLTSLEIPALDSYPLGMLSGCSNLKKITFATLNVKLGKVFGTDSYSGGEETVQGSDTYYIPWRLDQVTVKSGSLAAYAFAKCQYIKNITLPSNLTSIPNYCFYNCSILASVTIPASVTTIGKYAFAGCEDTYISCGSGIGVTSIGEYAFFDCRDLVDSTFGLLVTSKLDSMGKSAFSNCKSLKYISIHGSSSFKTLPDSAFYNCSSLYSVYIYAPITTIKAYAFGYCDHLHSLHLKTNVTTIENYALKPELYYYDGLTIYYQGTEKQWKAVSKGANDPYSSITVEYDGF